MFRIRNAPGFKQEKESPVWDQTFYSRGLCDPGATLARLVKIRAI